MSFEDEEEGGERDAALGGVAQYVGSLSLTSKSMKGADCNEDEGVAA